MQMNSYGWVILIVIVILFTSWIGSEAGYTVNGIPADTGTLDFLGNLIIGQIDGMPFIFTLLFDTVIPFLLGWIVYRQIRGQD